MADKFTQQQRAVIENRGGDLLVSAAAGSGKTTVLVERIMRYLLDEQQPANLDDFLMITYTKAAAMELRAKIAARLSALIAEHPENRHLRLQVQRLYLAEISTVHAFCGDILRQYAYQIDLPMDFRVADESECSQLRENAAAKVIESAYDSEDPDFCAFADTQAMGRNDSTVPEIVLKIYDASRCHLNPDGWLSQCLEESAGGENADPCRTRWGEFLADEMRRFLDLQIPAMEACAAMARQVPKFEKAVAVLQSEIVQLHTLRDSSCWDDFVRNSQIQFHTLTFPTKNPAPEISNQIKAVRDALKARLGARTVWFSETADEIRQDASDLQAAARGVVGLVRRFAEEYTRAKESRRILDFSDLEHRCLDLLLGKKREQATRFAREIGSRYREVMVDEYQDSNQVQDGIFRALTQEKHNLFMVGDVKQSIYRFRLADPGIFLEKYHAFSMTGEEDPGQGRKILLSRNFRSGAGVIDGVNDVFFRCMSQEVGSIDYTKDEMLMEGVPHISLNEPEMEFYAIECGGNAYETEAEFAAGRIAQLLDGSHFVRDGDALRPICPEDVVILLRSPSTNGAFFESALEKRGIRCNNGAGKDLLQSEEIGAIRALLTCISNPRDDIALLGVLSSPLVGFTADELVQIRMLDRDGAIYDALQRSDSAKVQDFLRDLEILRTTARSDSLCALIGEIYLRYCPEGIYRLRGGEACVSSLQSFFQIAVDYENGGRRDLDQFLAYLSSMEKKGLQISDGASGTGCVSIMSIHKSKGLEFPVVFLCGLSKTFNRDSSKGRVLCDREMGVGLSVMDEENRILYPSLAKNAIAVKERKESLSEEMRVLYVAMTRAKDRLIMTYTRKNIGKFLSDLMNRMCLEDPRLFCGSVSSMGEWVLLEALYHTEAGQLFSAGERHHETYAGTHPWRIELVSGEDELAPAQIIPVKQEPEQVTVPDRMVEKIREGLFFAYPHGAATREPSKRTATEQKGRRKDEEIAEHTNPEKKPVVKWREAGASSDAGKKRGSAVHRAMQYLDFSVCSDVERIPGELSRLRNQGILDDEQLKSIDPGWIANFFRSQIGKRFCSSDSLIREFKFSILEPGEKQDPALAGETILLQGVVDCAILEPDGMVLLDFKTDWVSDPEQIAQRYAGQVNAYAGAMERIFETRVKEKYLFLLRTGELVPVK